MYQLYMLAEALIIILYNIYMLYVLILGIQIVIFSVYASAFFVKQTNPWEPALRMYRGMFIVILDIFLLGINTYGWRSSGVNHVLIFEIDPRRHLTHQQLMEVMHHFTMISLNHFSPRLTFFQRRSDWSHWISTVCHSSKIYKKKP